MTISDSSMVCCDANLLVRSVTDLSASHIRELLGSWREAGVVVVAPALFPFEVTNAIHRIAVNAGFSDPYALTLLKEALLYHVELRRNDGLHLRALEFSRVFKLAEAYDAHYLALAESLGCRFYTSDAKLHRAVGKSLPWVILV